MLGLTELRAHALADDGPTETYVDSHPRGDGVPRRTAGRMATIEIVFVVDDPALVGDLDHPAGLDRLADADRLGQRIAERRLQRRRRGVGRRLAHSCVVAGLEVLQGKRLPLAVVGRGLARHERMHAVLRNRVREALRMGREG